MEIHVYISRQRLNLSVFQCVSTTSFPPPSLLCLSLFGPRYLCAISDALVCLHICLLCAYISIVNQVCGLSNIAIRLRQTYNNDGTFMPRIVEFRLCWYIARYIMHWWSVVVSVRWCFGGDDDGNWDGRSDYDRFRTEQKAVDFVCTKYRAMHAWNR